jgi:hypothetical protein
VSFTTKGVQKEEEERAQGEAGGFHALGGGGHALGGDWSRSGVRGGGGEDTRADYCASDQSVLPFA